MKSTPRNLFMSALYGGRKGERPPTGTPTSIICHDLMDAVGISFPEAHLDPKLMADLALGGHEVIGFDTVMPEYSVHQEAAALGCEMDWGRRDMMPDAVSTPYADFSNIEIPDNLLEKPSIKIVLEALSRLRSAVGDHVAVIGKVMGPWTISYHTAGTQNFLLNVGLSKMDQAKKDNVNRMLDQLMPVTIAHARAQFQAGADAVVLADHATGDLVGPYHYEEFLLPRHKILTQEIGGPLILHVCGNCSDRWEMFADAGFDAYHFEYKSGPKEAVERIGDRLTLVGPINNPDVLFQGTPEDVYNQARESIAAGVKIIGPECAIPLGTPLENLKAIVAACAAGY